MWRVHRVEAGFFEDRWSLDAPKVRSDRVLVFATRVTTKDWAPRLESDSFERAWLRRLDENEERRLQALLDSAPTFRERLTEYEPPAIDLICNIGFGQTAVDLAAECDRLFSHVISQGLTLDQVLAIVAASDFAAARGKNPQCNTLQLVSPGHLRRGDDFILTSFNVLDF